MTSTDERVAEVLRWLARRASARNVAGMARYGITPRRVYGVSMATMRPLVRRLGRDHGLARALWATGWYEARILAAFVGDPAALTRAEMNRWARDFDNWAVCDGCCIHLFVKSRHAWPMATTWSSRRGEFVKRAGFALLASLAVHDRAAGDAPFLEALRLVEREATDHRNYVKKAVNWALRGIGSRNSVLHAAALTVAARLAASTDATARWVGKDAVRALEGEAVRRRLARGDRGAAARRAAPP